MMALVLAVLLAAPQTMLAVPSVGLAAPAAALHFSRAQKLFAQGRYRDALDEFTAASEAAPREVPDLWFDIGQCHRNLGNARQAVAAFRRYLALRPDAPDRARVVAMIERLGGSIDDLPDAPATPTGSPGSTGTVALVSAVSPAPDPAPPVLAPGEGPSPPTTTLPGASDIPAAGPRAEASSSSSLALIPADGRASPPPTTKRRRTWPIWVGVASAVATAAAVGIGVGVAYGSPSHPAMTPMPGSMGSTSLGTNVTFDTRGGR
jgi:hypothetical protein